MTGIPITSIELYPISPTLSGAPIFPDQVSVQKPGVDFATLVDADFYDTKTLDGGPAVLISGLTAGPYKVVCRMDAQGDGQRPVWELDGEIKINQKV